MLLSPPPLKSPPTVSGEREKKKKRKGKKKIKEKEKNPVLKLILRVLFSTSLFTQIQSKQILLLFLKVVHLWQ